MIQRLYLMIFKYVEKLYQKDKYYLPKTQYCILETLTALFATIFSDFSFQEQCWFCRFVGIEYSIYGVQKIVKYIIHPIYFLHFIFT